MTEIKFINMPVDSPEFRQMVSEISKIAISNFLNQKEPFSDIPDKIRKRQTVADILKISYSTVGLWINEAKLKRHRDEEGKAYFEKSEVLELL